MWFHGGSLTGGSRYFPNLKDQGIALVGVSYRLASKVQPPAYIEDSAAAVAWVLKNIERYGGDPKKVFVAGHSAGALSRFDGRDGSEVAQRAPAI